MPRGRPKKVQTTTNQILGLNQSQKECLQKTLETIQSVTSYYADFIHPSVEDIINLERVGWTLKHEFKEYMKDE